MTSFNFWCKYLKFKMLDLFGFWLKLERHWGALNFPVEMF